MQVKTRLSLKVMLGMVGMLLAGSWVVVYFAGERKDAVLERIYQDQSLLMASSLDASLGEVDLGDEEALQRQVQKYLWLNPDVLQLAITRWDGEGVVVVASTNMEEVSRRGDMSNLTAYEKDETYSEFGEMNGERVIRVISPVHVGGMVVGTYDMTFSLQARDDFVGGAVRELGLILLVLMGVLVVGIAVIIRVLVVRPVRQLVEGVNEFGEGRLERRIELRGGDELAALAEGFNQMAEKIQRQSMDMANEIERQTKAIELANRDLEDQQLALLNVLEDVSEEKEYETSRSKSLLETVSEGIVVVDDRGRVVYVNPAFEQLARKEEEKLKGRVLADELKLYDLKDNPLPPETLASSALVTQARGETKLQLSTEGEEKVAVSISAAPIYQAGEFKGVVMVFHDFSEDLALQKQKDDFFSMASHELRTPLTVIAGNLDMIIGGVGGTKLTGEDAEMLGDTLEAVDRLTRMVADFLNVSRIDQGRLKLRSDEVKICLLIEEIAKEYQGQVEQKGLELKVSCPQPELVVMGDEDKLREVVVNLLGNSLKFTKQGKIEIEVESGEHELVVRVKDTGIGIAKDKQKLLFGRFQQAMDRTLVREAGGTGLGLYISREFVRLMGGDMKLEKSELEVGSVFSFTIPVSKSGAESGGEGQGDDITNGSNSNKRRKGVK